MVSLGLLVSTPSMPVIHPNQRHDQLHFVLSLRTIRARMMQKNTLKRKSPNFFNSGFVSVHTDDRTRPVSRTLRNKIAGLCCIDGIFLLSYTLCAF